jgi:hypothetical protein
MPAPGAGVTIPDLVFHDRRAGASSRTMKPIAASEWLSQN